MTLRKTFEGDFKKMEPTWETAEGEATEFIVEKDQVQYPERIKAIKEEEDVYKLRMELFCCLQGKYLLRKQSLKVCAQKVNFNLLRLTKRPNCLVQNGQTAPNFRVKIVKLTK